MKDRVLLYNGDCLEVMDRLIQDGIKVDAVITDPPYGITQNKWDSVIPLNEMWERLGKLSNRNTAVVLFGSEPFSSTLRMSNIEQYKYDWSWVKNNATGHLNAKRKPMKIFENIMVFGSSKTPYDPQNLIPFNKKIKRGHNGGNYGTSGNENFQEFTNFPIDILCFDYPRKKTHPTQKPVELMEYLIKTYTNEGDTVLDFTMGSGTTGVACMKTNRKFIGIELDEKYFKISEARINRGDRDGE